MVAPNKNNLLVDISVIDKLMDGVLSQDEENRIC